MAALSINQYLKTLVYTDAQSQESASVGTVQEVFNAFTARINVSKKLREDGTLKACTIMMTNKKTGKVTWLTCSKALSPFVRSGEITLDHIAGFPVFRSETNDGNYVGFPASATPTVDVAEIEIVEYVAKAIAHNELLA